ncbi:MAG: UbiA prenyltransferase family protein [Thermoplasmata archaeon]|nr:MAG: UbiA prenyltransferase family protein [Thermoplasmata archaeon]
MSWGKGLGITLRPIVSMVTIPWTLALAVFAASIYGDFGTDIWSSSEYWMTLLFVVLASYLGVTAGYAVNDYFDYDVDVANPVRQDKAANHGISKGSLLSYAAVLGIPSLVIWLYLSHMAFLVAIVQLLCILAYSGWAKANTPYSNLFVVLPTALMPVTVFFVYTPDLTKEAILLASVNGVFEPGFTWAGVCRDVEADAKLGVRSLPILRGIPAVARMVLVMWIGLAVLTVVTWYYTDLGLVFLIGAMFAAIWLIANGVAFVKEPTPEMGGGTFLKAILWFWVFSISLIVDTAFNIQVL